MNGAAIPTVPLLANALVAGQRRALAKAITLIESSRDADREAADQLLAMLLEHTGGSLRVGISGAPGVGKSCLIEALGMHLVSLGARLAVLAVDPSSSRSGGSILGDKTRMPELAAHPSAFIRPTPAGGTLGGVAKRTREALLLCEAAGFDYTIVETVGVGQSEYVVAGMVDVMVLLLQAGGGDGLQGIKRGIHEVADVMVVTKADGPNVAAATNTCAEYRAAVQLLSASPSALTPTVLTVSAHSKTRIDALFQEILAQRDAIDARFGIEQKRRAQLRACLDQATQDGLSAQFRALPRVSRALDAITEAVQSSQITTYEGARRLLGLASQR